MVDGVVCARGVDSEGVMRDDRATVRCQQESMSKDDTYVRLLVSTEISVMLLLPAMSTT